MNKAYKLFRVSKKNKGCLYPLFVNANKVIPIGEWIEAECGEKDCNGKVKSRLGSLCFRPGWHLSDIPYAPHIGKKGDSGNIEYMNENYVWCACVYSDNNNYQDVVNRIGLNKKGVIIPKNAYLKSIPFNGYYRYKTNPNMYEDWIIAGSIKVLRVLSDEEVNDILTKNKIKPMPRHGGRLDLNEFGFII